MAAGPWLFTNATITALLTGTFLAADTYKIALLASTSNIGSGTTTFAGVTGELSTANGYTGGGASTTVTVSGTTTVTIDCSDVSWTASGGSITARWACLYEVSGNVLCYFLLDGTNVDVTATAGNPLPIVIHASGVITATKV